MKTLGVDISEHNGKVNFNALKSYGVKFVIIRCGFGSDYVNQDDSRFEENVKGAESAGLPWGVYLYSYAKNPSMASSEAQHVLRLLNGRRPLYGVWYDVEDPQLSSVDVVSTCVTFCEAIESSGLYVGIYSMLSWLNGKLNSSKLDAYDKWVAQWNSVCQYENPYGIWQFTDSLSIGGKSFDGNYAYNDYPTIIQGKDEDEMCDYKTFKLYMDRYLKELASQSASDWAQPAIEKCKSLSIMNGDADGKFRPCSYLTRQEAAQVALNIFNALGGGDT